MRASGIIGKGEMSDNKRRYERKMTKGIRGFDRSNVGRGHQAARRQSDKSDRSGREWVIPQ